MPLSPTFKTSSNARSLSAHYGQTLIRQPPPPPPPPVMPADDQDDVHDHHRHQMPTTTNPTNRNPPFLSTLTTVFADSFEILISNPKIFSSILLLLALPLSYLLSSLSLSSTALRRRVVHLQSLATIVSVRIEALNILDEARKDAKSLFRLRALHALVTLPISVLVLITTASSSASFLRRRRRSPISSLSSAVRSSWWRSLLTGLLAHVVAIVYGELAQAAAAVAAVVAGPATGFAVAFATISAEFFLKSVLEMGMVVTVVEERWFGVDAFRIGWELLAGRRMVGWAVAAVVEVTTGFVWWSMVGSEEIDVYGGDWKAGFRSTDGLSLRWKAGMVSLYALVMVCTNVLVTSLNYECTGGFKLVADDTFI